jgi:hypothetical protein
MIIPGAEAALRMTFNTQVMISVLSKENVELYLCSPSGNS